MKMHTAILRNMAKSGSWDPVIATFVQESLAKDHLTLSSFRENLK